MTFTLATDATPTCQPAWLDGRQPKPRRCRRKRRSPITRRQRQLPARLTTTTGSVMTVDIYAKQTVDGPRAICRTISGCGGAPSAELRQMSR
jgi:hypothetical protein